MALFSQPLWRSCHLCNIEKKSHIKITILLELLNEDSVAILPQKEIQCYNFCQLSEVATHSLPVRIYSTSQLLKLFKNLHHQYEGLFATLHFLFYAKQVFHIQVSYYSEATVHQIVL